MSDFCLWCLITSVKLCIDECIYFRSIFWCYSVLMRQEIFSVHGIYGHSWAEVWHISPHSLPTSEKIFAHHAEFTNIRFTVKKELCCAWGWVTLCCVYSSLLQHGGFINVSSKIKVHSGKQCIWDEQHQEEREGGFLRVDSFRLGSGTASPERPALAWAAGAKGVPRFGGP